MDGRLLALASSVLFALGPVMLSLGLQNASTEVAVLTTFVVGLPLLLLLSPFLGGLHFADLSVGTILLFSLGGLLGPLFGRIFLYSGIARLGSSRAFTIKNAAPLVTGIVAILVLSEPVSLRRWTSIAVIVIGLAIVGKGTNASPGSLRLSGMILAFLSALSFGIRPIVFKIGLQETADPITASVIATAAALLGFSAYLLLSGRLRSLHFNRRSLKLFAIVGSTHTLGFLTINYAFNASDVTLVYPISASAPVLTFGLSYFITKNVEKLTALDLVGTVAVMIGVTLLFL